MPNGHEQKSQTVTVHVGASSRLLRVDDSIRTFVLCQVKKTGMPLSRSDIPADLVALSLVGGTAAAHRIQLCLERVELVGERLKLGARRDTVA